ncbi:Zn-dependent hydrolase [Cohnella endophytica]|nr:Zn-dependent hydrolase [Cohnella endophytica]
MDKLEPTVNGERLWEELLQLGRIGLSPSGGINRPSLGVHDLIAREYIRERMQTAGLSVRLDPAGNLVGRLEGTDPDAPVVMAGSHIDTVLEAGRFDGPLGVLGGIEALRTVKEKGLRHRCSLEVVCFTDEEGVRFGVGYIGSRAMAGDWNAEWLNARDRDGISLGEAMRQAGIRPEEVALSKRGAGSVKVYLELHIEQGRVLEDVGAVCGIASAINGYRWVRASFAGQADHAGTTPMALRRDAMAAAAEAMLQIERSAVRHGGTATVGTLKLEPGAVNVIPGEVSFTIDYRHPDALALKRFGEEIESELGVIALRRNIGLRLEEMDGEAPVACDERISMLFAESANELGIASIGMVCGAGHDAVAMRRLTDIGLILVRSRGGISHHPDEWSSPEDCAGGANVLLRTMIKLANE